MTGHMRIGSGVEGFDTVVDGGLPADRLYILSGPPGSGKTTFSVQFLLEGVRSGQRCLYVSMHETRAELLRAFDGFELDLEAALGSDRFQFVNVFDDEDRGLLTPAREGDYRTSLRNQIRRVRKFVEDAGVDRLVLDSTMLLRHFFSEDADTFIKFLQGLKRVDATVVLVSEMTDPTAYGDDHYLAHGLIFLHNVLDREAGAMTRGVQVIKMRGAAVDTDIHRLVFTTGGIEVRPGEPMDAGDVEVTRG